MIKWVMADKREIIQIRGEQGLAFVKRQTRQVLEDLGPGVEFDTKALSFVIGGSSHVLEKLGKKGTVIAIRPTRGDLWFMSLRKGGQAEATARNQYLHVFEEASKRVAVDQRPDVILDLQVPVHFLFGLLPPAAQDALRKEGKSPEIIASHNPAF